jgi:hypothetical protein
MTGKSGQGICQGCGKASWLMPLHGDRGGKMLCFMCAGEWQAKNGRRRRAERVVIKAIKGYKDAGGRIYGDGFDNLKSAADGLYLGAGLDESRSFGDFADLTTELLDATIALTHPDKHPAERKAEANRVTQELMRLRPFVFPAPPPEPPPPPMPYSDGSLKSNTVI